MASSGSNGGGGNSCGGSSSNSGGNGSNSGSSSSSVNQEEEVGSVSNFWVFGYGSLVWKPGFAFTESKIGYVNGYSRRFYQGNDVQRGSPEKLGRVVTLIEEEGAVTWGRAFQLKDAETARQYLDHRESSLGGYSTFFTLFAPRDPKESLFPVLVYVALPSNPLFLGSAPAPQMALEIAQSEGNCGHNVEYLARLAAFMKLEVPHFWDEHLNELDSLVRDHVSTHSPTLLVHFEVAYLPNRVFERSCSVESNSMSLLKEDTTATKSSSEGDSELVDMLSAGVDGMVLIESSSSSSNSESSSPVPPQFADMVPTRKSRCLNI